MIVLGISAYYHDSAATIIKNGEIIAAVSEERFNRIKGYSGFPRLSVNYCLNEAGINLDEVDHIVYYENYFNKFSRIIKDFHMNAPFNLVSYLYGLPKWLTDKLWLENRIKKELNTKKNIVFLDHHISHAASAFYPSPFKDAAILTIDGVGEWSTTTIGKGHNEKIELLKELRYPDSIGFLYSAFTYFCGFKVNSGEYKLMGLAPYGKPIYVDLIKKELVEIYDDGSIKLNLAYFNFNKGLTMCSKKFDRLFNAKPRKEGEEITQLYMDLAASIQKVTEEIMLRLADYAYKITKCDNLVMAGGCALNVTAIGMLRRESKFKSIWVQPASGDAGGSLGAALYTYYALGNKRDVNPDDSMKSSLLGPSISNSKEIDELLEANGAVFKYIKDDDELAKTVADLLAKGKIVGVAKGRMEFGPRALGDRSILGDARIPDLQKTMNLKIKHRESFRPFAPIVLESDMNDYFENCDYSPYMLATYFVKKDIRKKVKNESGIGAINEIRSTVPAITHIDYSARVQTVNKKMFPFTYNILNEFKKLTGSSVLVNTSFNVRGEPIVDNEINAFRCFMNTDIDYVVIGNRLLDKSKQNADLFHKMNKTGGFKLD